MSKIYVSTYRKYNEGNLKGEWLDLSNFSSKEEFIEACIQLHADEDQPELMFQDWEDVPSSFVGESFLDDRIWEWINLDSHEKEAVQAYMENVDHLATIATAIESYSGTHDSPEAWAMEFWEETGMLDQVPEFAQGYIDYEQFARDARLGGDMVFVEKGRRVRAFRCN